VPQQHRAAARRSAADAGSAMLTAEFHFTITTTTLLLLYPFKGLFSRITWLRKYQKGKTSLDLNEARGDEVLGRQWHQLGHMQTISTWLQTNNHTNTSFLNFLQAGCSSCAQPTVSKH